MGFNATFNTISVISWLSVLLVEETGVPGENHASHCQILSHSDVSSAARQERDLTHNFSGINYCYSYNNYKRKTLCILQPDRMF